MNSSCQKSRVLYSDYRADQSTEPPRPSAVHRMFCWKRGVKDLVCHCTWTACFVVDEDAYFARDLEDNETKTEGTLHLPVCYVRQLAIIAELLRCPHRHGWKIVISILKGRRSGSSSQTRAIWKYTAAHCLMCIKDVWYRLCVCSILCGKPRLRNHRCSTVSMNTGCYCR